MKMDAEDIRYIDDKFSKLHEVISENNKCNGIIKERVNNLENRVDYQGEKINKHINPDENMPMCNNIGRHWDKEHKGMVGKLILYGGAIAGAISAIIVLLIQLHIIHL